MIKIVEESITENENQSHALSFEPQVIQCILRTMNEPRVSQMQTDEVSASLDEECAKLREQFRLRFQGKHDKILEDLHVINNTGIICTTGELSRIRLQKLVDRFRAERLMRVRLMQLILSSRLEKRCPEVRDASCSCSIGNDDEVVDKTVAKKSSSRCGRMAISRIFSPCKRPIVLYDGAGVEETAAGVAVAELASMQR